MTQKPKQPTWAAPAPSSVSLVVIGLLLLFALPRLSGSAQQRQLNGNPDAAAAATITSQEETAAEPR